MQFAWDIPIVLGGAAILIPLAISVALAGASMAIQYIAIRKMKQKPLERGRNDDIRIMGSDYGAYIPRIWGKVRFAPQLIYSTGIRVVKIESTQRTSSGNKGGGPPPQKTIDYNYYTTIQLLACKGEADITKIWANTDIIYSYTPDRNSQYFEAEAGTLSGGASIVVDAACSNGNKVTLDAAGEKVQFTLAAPVAPSDTQIDTYTLLTIYYKAASAAAIGVAINGGSATAHNVVATGSAPATKVIRIESHPSTIELTYSGSVAVSIDRIATWFSFLNVYPDDIPVTGIRDPIIDDTLTDFFYPYVKHNYLPTPDGSGRTSFTATNTGNIRTYRGTATQTQDAALVADMDARFGAGQGANRISAHRGYVYAVLQDHLIPNGQLENFTFEVDEGTTSVAAIITDLYAEKNIGAGDLDLTALAGLTRTGLIVNSLTSPNKIIQDLENWYHFKMVEMDGKIKAVLNFSTPIETISRDDLRAYSEDDEMPPADATIIDIPEEDLPATVYVNYLDTALEGKNNTQQSDLHASTLALDTVTLSFPFTSTEPEAKGVSDKILLERHMRDRSYEFFVAPKHARKSVGDCVILDLASGDHVVQLVKEQKTFAGVIRFNAESVAEVNVTNNTTLASTVSDILGDAARFAPNTKLFAVDSQPIELFHEGLGFYAGVCGGGVGKWNGCGLYHRLTTGADPEPIQNVFNSAGIGVGQTALGTHSGSAEDTTNDLTIYFYNDVELETVTTEQLDASGILNLIRIGGEWVQYRTATAAALPDGSNFRSAWTIENLRRGRFGTSDKIATHLDDEECCTYAGMQFFNLDSRYYGANAIITAVSLGQNFDDGSTVTFAVTGQSLQGQAPSDLPGRINNQAAVIVQNGTATNTTVNVTVSGYSNINNYRKIEYSTVAALASGVTEVIINGFELANFLLPQEQSVVTTSLSSATVKYIAISHSPDGINWSARSNIIAVTFASSGGGGGGSGDTPPTFTSIAYDTPNSEADLVFAKNGTATGNIEVEYKLTSDSVWTTHGTTFAHGATSGSIVITEQPTAQTYDVRLKQVGVSGYSVTRQVTVDASGAGTPPSNLQSLEEETATCDWEISLEWTAGSGSGNYTVERKIGTGGWTTLTSTNADTDYVTTFSGGPTSSTTLYFRVKQNDVSGYSNTTSVFIPRCIL